MKTAPLLASSLMLMACGDPEGPAPSKPTPVVIGVSMGASGRLASIVQPLRQAIQLAERQVNANGGIAGGRTVSFNIVDDSSSDNAEVLSRTFGGLFANKAIAAIGPVGSSQVSALGALISGNNYLTISPSATLPELTANGSFGGNFFRTAPSDTLQVKALVNILKNGPTNNFGGTSTTCKKLGILYTNESYPIGLAVALETAWKAESGTTVFKVDPPPADNAVSDFSNAISQLEAAAPDCLAVLAYQPAASAFLRALAPKPLFTALKLRLGPEALYTDTFVAAANDGVLSGPLPAENFVGAAPVTNPERQAYRDFLLVLSAQDPALAARPNIDYPYFTAAYDAAVLLAMAAHQSNGAGGSALRDALLAVSKGGTGYTPVLLPDALRAISRGEDIDYDGASGPCDFDAKGDVTSDYAVWRVESSKRIIKRTIAAKDVQ